MSQDSTMVIAIYGTMSLSLVGVGFYSLKKGFDLIDRHQSNKEYSTIQLGKLRVSLGSLGGLVMMTSFMWGYAATKVLPRYQDGDTIISMQKQLHSTRIKLEETQKAAEENSQKIVAVTEAVKTDPKLKKKIEGQKK